MVGVKGSKGFPEQFDDLCHTTVEPYVLFRETLSLEKPKRENGIT